MSWASRTTRAGAAVESRVSAPEPRCTHNERPGSVNPSRAAAPAALHRGVLIGDSPRHCKSKVQIPAPSRTWTHGPLLPAPMVRERVLAIRASLFIPTGPRLRSGATQYREGAVPGRPKRGRRSRRSRREWAVASPAFHATLIVNEAQLARRVDERPVCVAPRSDHGCPSCARAARCAVGVACMVLASALRSKMRRRAITARTHRQPLPRCGSVGAVGLGPIRRPAPEEAYALVAAPERETAVIEFENVFDCSSGR